MSRERLGRRTAQTLPFEPTEERGDVSKGGKIVAYCRDIFFEVEPAFRVGGVEIVAELPIDAGSNLVQISGRRWRLVDSVSKA